MSRIDFCNGLIHCAAKVFGGRGERDDEFLTAATGAITVGSSSDYTMYTKDGTDPRYSTTAVKITSGTTPSHTSGDTIKAVSYKAGKCVSDVISQVTTS